MKRARGANYPSASDSASNQQLVVIVRQEPLSAVDKSLWGRP
jgi:hypothetical protein